MTPIQNDLEALAARVAERLLTKEQVLAIAESCTGGWVGQCLTAIAGSSLWFDRGFVTYSNAAKIEMLDVPARTSGWLRVSKARSATSSRA